MLNVKCFEKIVFSLHWNFHFAHSILKFERRFLIFNSFDQQILPYTCSLTCPLLNPDVTCLLIQGQYCHHNNNGLAGVSRGELDPRSGDRSARADPDPLRDVEHLPLLLQVLRVRRRDGRLRLSPHSHLRLPPATPRQLLVSLHSSLLFSSFSITVALGSCYVAILISQSVILLGPCVCLNLQSRITGSTIGYAGSASRWCVLLCGRSAGASTFAVLNISNLLGQQWLSWITRANSMPTVCLFFLNVFY